MTTNKTIMKSKKKLFQFLLFSISVLVVVFVFHSFFAESLEFVDYIQLEPTNADVNSNSQQQNRQTRRPVLVSAFSSDHYYEAQGLIHSIHQYLPYYQLVVYDLGLKASQRDQLIQYCRCQVRQFQFDHYPAHVSNLRTYAFKPIIVNQTIEEFRFIFWIDSSVRFLTTQVENVWRQAETVGFGSTQDGSVISCLTHPSMFTALGVSDPTVYEKAREVSATFVLFTDKPVIMQELIQPWLKCALDVNCIAPEGHQLYGCRFEVSPQFCGCHRYDQSALGILVYRIYQGQFVYDGKSGTGNYAPFFIGNSGIIAIRRTHKVSYFPAQM